MDFHLLLRFAVENDASDVHIQAGLRPSLRMGGHLRSTDEPPLTDESIRAFIAEIAPPRMRGTSTSAWRGGWTSRTRRRSSRAYAARRTATSGTRASRCA